MDDRARSGEGWRFRPIGHEDAGLYPRLYCDPRVLRQVGAPLGASAAAAAHAAALRFNQRATPGQGEFAVLDRGRTVGLMRLADAPHAHWLEVGLLLVPEAHGRGIGSWALSEAAQHAAAHGFDGLWMAYRTDNPPMLRIVEKLREWGQRVGIALAFQPVPPPAGPEDVRASAP